MLTAKENMRETVRCGKPDRFVNQYEALGLAINPFFMVNPMPRKGEMRVRNAWGVLQSWPDYVPGPFPDHNDPKDILVPDIEHWRDYVKAPALDMPQEMWDICLGMLEEFDDDKAFRTVFVVPGIFEQTHYFCSMQEALVNYIEYGDEMHDLIKMLKEWELELAELICEKLHPEAILHHDDFGTERNSFMSPDIIAEFLLEPYREIYGYYHEHGVELVVHHSDSYCANLVDIMIDMGIDVWQGVMRSNNVEELLEKYRGKITFMGNIDNKQLDFDGWTTEDCEKAARLATDGFDPLLGGYIPCITQGGPGSVYPGAYVECADYIDRINSERYGFSIEDLADARVPHLVKDAF